MSVDSLALLVVILRKFNFRSGSDFGGCEGWTACQVTPRRFFFLFCAPPVSKVSFLGRQYEAFKWHAKNQTLGWTVYIAFPTAAVKIKENKQQITRRGAGTLYTLFAFMSLLGVAAPCWTCAAAAAKKKITSFFFPETLYFLQNVRWGGGVTAEKCAFSAKFATP